MAPPTPTPLLDDDDDYNSSEDADFDPTAPSAAIPLDSDSDPDTPLKRKRRASDSDGEGGLIKTRAQRARESAEKTTVGSIIQSKAGTDVDELWRQMNSKPTKEASPEEEEEEKKKDEKPITTAEGEETVTISRTYTFAGTTHTEHKTVPKSSQEAQTYLSSAAAAPTTATPAPNPTRRPPPKKRASVFDAAAAARKPVAAQQPAKMNTLEKSRLDWAGFVDKEGIGEELKKHTKGDKAYLDRQAFLGRVEEKRDKTWKEGQKKKA